MTDLPIKPFISKLNQVRSINAVFEKALLLYVLLIDADIPAWAKAMVISTLVYLIDPLDVIPDITPFIGVLDDLTLMISTTKAISAHIQPHHRSQAKSLAFEL
jgi:uncharacterized membrane protein YkvA (DUF1232 family)